MDFFERQRRARRWTGWLILAFLLAIFVVGLSVHVGVMGVILLADKNDHGSFFRGIFEHPESLTVFIVSQIAVAAIVGLGSLFKIKRLAEGGGEYVAEILGGREVSPYTFRFEEKQLLNIVEEMAIAAGMIVPAVYILDKEHRVNSFAAGFDQDSAVIGITRGALDYLTRDELQALVAHEFSHILNGDITLNMRTIGVLYGLSMVTQLGLAFSLLHPDIQENEDMSALSFMLFHPVLFVTFLGGISFALLGSFGWMLGAGIKTAIARQREFLADASALQYTRNPGALKTAFIKTGCPRVGTMVYSAHALEASHIFIGNVFNRSSRWNPFAAHPDWTSRIRRFDPGFNGVFPESVPRIRRYGKDAITGAPSAAMIDELLGSTNPRLGRFFARKRIEEARLQGPRQTQPVVHHAENISDTEIPSEESQPNAAPLPLTLPPVIRGSLKTPAGVCSLIYALLLDKEQRYREPQLVELAGLLPMSTLEHVQSISRAVVESFSIRDTLSPTPQARKRRSAFIRIRNKTLSEGLPKIRELSIEDYALFRRICMHLNGNPQKINLFRYTLFTAFQNGLDSYFSYGNASRNKRAEPAPLQSLSAIEPSLRLALSYLAYAGHGNRDDAMDAFQSGLKIVGLRDSGQNGILLPIDDCTFRALDESLRRMQTATPPIREKCLLAFRTVLWNDGKMTSREEEIYLAVSTALATSDH